MHSIPNLPNHLQQKAGGESTPAGAQQKLLGCSYAGLCSEPSLMGASQLFLISTDVLMDQILTRRARKRS